jgi:aminoglycoside N3'-acetyltransferase
VSEDAPVTVDGERRWVRFRELVVDRGDFGEIGRDFAGLPGAERRGPVGAGESVLIPQRGLVDFAMDWILKTARAAKLSGVRIPLPPPENPCRTRAFWQDGVWCVYAVLGV